MDSKTYCVHCGSFFLTAALFKKHFYYKKKCSKARLASTDAFVESYFDIPKSPIKKVKPRELGLLELGVQTEEEYAYPPGTFGESDTDSEKSNVAEIYDIDREFYDMGRDIHVEEYKLEDPTDEDEEGEAFDPEEEVDIVGMNENHEHEPEGEEDLAIPHGRLLVGESTATTVIAVVPVCPRTSLKDWRNVFGDQVDMTLMEKREATFDKGYQGSKFSVDQEIRIELAAKIDKAKAPLNAFDSLLAWGKSLAPDAIFGRVRRFCFWPKSRRFCFRQFLVHCCLSFLTLFVVFFSFF